MSRTLPDLELTNQCLVVCDLAKPDTPWQVIKGSQDEAGAALAKIVADAGVRRFDDFGGVCETFLCESDVYLATPPRIAGEAAVFSFTPKKKLLAEGEEMARVSRAAGYRLLVVTVQKHDKFGKVWVLCGLLRHHSGEPLTYFEDTNTIVDELKSSPERDRIVAVHVQTPGFEQYVSELADRVVSQSAGLSRGSVGMNGVSRETDHPHNPVKYPWSAAALGGERRSRRRGRRRSTSSRRNLVHHIHPHRLIVVQKRRHRHDSVSAQIPSVSSPPRKMWTRMRIEPVAVTSSARVRRRSWRRPEKLRLRGR